MSDFEGLKALVTGGASGIGRATAELLASRGAQVAVLDLDPASVEKPLLGYQADVTDDESVRRAVAAAVADLGGRDVLINNAGIGAQGTVDTPWVGRLLDAATDPAAERAALEARQPTGRLVSASEVAGAVAYLASPLSGATTGTALAVDGGMQGLRLRPAGQ